MTDLHQLPAWPQSQQPLSEQMAALVQVANRLGLYDAADAVQQLLANYQAPPRHGSPAMTAPNRPPLSPAPAPAGEVCKEEIDCETCGGSGTIDETLGGYGDSNQAATCPDCDGIGVITVPAPVPAGEVAELVAWLRAWARGTLEEGQPATSRSLTRAADLVERHAALVPVAEGE